MVDTLVVDILVVDNPAVPVADNPVDTRAVPGVDIQVVLVVDRPVVVDILAVVEEDLRVVVDNPTARYMEAELEQLQLFFVMEWIIQNNSEIK